MIQTFAWYWVVGVVYSLLFPLFGGWLTLYVGRFSTLQSFLIGTVLGLLAIVLEKSSGKSWLPSGVLWGICTLHSSHWLFHYSPAGGWPIIQAVGAIATVSLAVVLLLIGVKTFRTREVHWTLMAGVFGLFLVISKAYTIQTLPLSFLGDSLVTSKTTLANEPDRSYLSKILYPFSIPLDEGLSRFGSTLLIEPPEKSILVLVPDALRKEYLGKEVGGQKITRSMNQLAEDGVVFDRYYVQSSWTKPSISSFFTGRYPHEHGVCLNPEKFGQRLPESYDTLGERIQSKGFATYGASFVSHLKSKYGSGQGFDLWISQDNHFRDDYTALRKVLLRYVREQPERLFIYLHAVGPHAPYGISLQNRWFWALTPYARNGKPSFPAWNLPDPSVFSRGKLDQWKENHPDKVLSNEEIRILRYLYLSKLNLYDRHYLKRLIRSLRGLNLYETSLITLTSDHGEDLFDRGYSHGTQSSRRLGHIHSLRELVINPPLIIKPPSGMENISGETNQSLVLESLDLSATLADYASTSTQGFRGKSFLDYFKPDRTLRKKDFDRAVAEICKLHGRPVTAVETMEQLSREELHDEIRISEAAIVKRRWKLLRNFTTAESYLYDLKNDPEELEVVTGREAKASELEDSLLKLLQGDTRIVDPPGALVPRNEQSRRNLRGFGYF